MSAFQQAIIQNLWAPHAYIKNARGESAWHTDVLLSIAKDGCWSSIQSGVAKPSQVDRADVEVISGALIPSFVNAHSHAFQRAFAGKSEKRQSLSDDFWSWRQQMYNVALKLSPAQMHVIASQLFIELLKGGYTHVCEFHYVYRQPDGSHYPDALAMARAIAQAAQDIGIGLTLLPVLYERAGFNQSHLAQDQRRFLMTASEVFYAAKTILAWDLPLVNSGVAIHSLRAAAPESLHQLKQLIENIDMPIHIHVSEQIAEVNECEKTYGARPIAYLGQQSLMDARWHLVHATHVLESEIEQVAQASAGLVLCPTTEANLGDGIADLKAWLKARVGISIGSDSHATRDAIEELRWLEYGQRLQHRQRNVSAENTLGASNAKRLVDLTTTGRAAGQEKWGLMVGARADALVLDTTQNSLLGLAPSNWLDGLLFASPNVAFSEVMVAGQWQVRLQVHRKSAEVAQRYLNVMEDF